MCHIFTLCCITLLLRHTSLYLTSKSLFISCFLELYMIILIKPVGGQYLTIASEENKLKHLNDCSV
jgi:hypothetical protein